MDEKGGGEGTYRCEKKGCSGSRPSKTKKGNDVTAPFTPVAERSLRRKGEFKRTGEAGRRASKPLSQIPDEVRASQRRRGERGEERCGNRCQ